MLVRKDATRVIQSPNKEVADFYRSNRPNSRCLMTTDYEHASSITRMKRGVELIEELRVHPYRQEIIELARQQLQDMNTLDVVIENEL